MYRINQVKVYEQAFDTYICRRHRQTNRVEVNMNRHRDAGDNYATNRWTLSPHFETGKYDWTSGRRNQPKRSARLRRNKR